MSAFVGPNLYQIVSALGNCSCKLELAGGDSANGTVVQSYNHDNHVNGQWVIASVGVGPTGKEEFPIINRASRTFLISPVEAQADIKNYCEPVGGITSGAFDQRARWFIIPLNNGFGRYIIAHTANQKFSLNVHSAAHSKNNKVILYATKDDTSHWYLKLAPNAISNAPRYQDTL